MPAVSKAQQELFAIAEHHPEELPAKDASLKRLSKTKLREFAATPITGLPEHTP